jgi:hypothetical protein
MNQQQLDSNNWPYIDLVSSTTGLARDFKAYYTWNIVYLAKVGVSGHMPDAKPDQLGLRLKLCDPIRD